MTNLKTDDRHGKTLSQIVCEEAVLYDGDNGEDEQEDEQEEEEKLFVGLHRVPEKFETRENLLTCIFSTRKKKN